MDDVKYTSSFLMIHLIKITSSAFTKRSSGTLKVRVSFTTIHEPPITQFALIQLKLCFFPHLVH